MRPRTQRGEAVHTFRPFAVEAHIDLALYPVLHIRSAGGFPPLALPFPRFASRRVEGVPRPHAVYSVCLYPLTTVHFCLRFPPSVRLIGLMLCYADLAIRVLKKFFSILLKFFLTSRQLPCKLLLPYIQFARPLTGVLGLFCVFCLVRTNNTTICSPLST